ncbi:ATP-binding protein [Cytobacillus gottheilii]|uniref:ATP-binding protein n=1 Tax=Cytobacillus gottheilii TaxID=859144 RepID=UPI003CF2103E
MNASPTEYKSSLEINPRVIYEALGSKIIESDSIAIAEQIKNASDAGASSINVDFSRLYTERIIVISDNGHGMTHSEINENWFFVGTENKNQDFQQLGGKGIGRFSLFRLADIIEIETIANSIKSTFEFNKYELQNYTSTSNIRINITETPVQQNDSGTKIILRNANTNIDLLEIQRELINLNFPFRKENFTVKYPDNIQLRDYLSPKEALYDAPMVAEVSFRGDKIISYRFASILEGQLLFQNQNPKKLFENMEKIEEKIDLGKIRVFISNYFFDNKWKVPMKYGRTIITEKFLSGYQGISVYRNGYKIYGHGSEDWLKLAEKRLVKPSQNIDNKQTFGFIELDSEGSITLEEKTNREGFIRNDSSRYFQNVIEAIVKQFGLDREHSIKEIKKYLSYSSINKNQNSNQSQNNNQDQNENHDQNKKQDQHKNHDQNKNQDQQENQYQDEKHDQNNNQGENKNKDENKDQDQNENHEQNNNSNKGNARGASHLNNKTIIDISFECPISTPEKIKTIVHELKYITNKNVNAQALLLRCLIDTSTKYFQDNNSLPHKNDLLGNVLASINVISNNQAIDRKHIQRVQTAIKKENIVSFFNGVAHEYDFRPNYSDIKSVWNIFESYLFCCMDSKKK